MSNQVARSYADYEGHCEDCERDLSIRVSLSPHASAWKFRYVRCGECGEIIACDNTLGRHQEDW